DPFAGRDQRVERLPELTPQRAHFGLHIHIGQRQFFLRQFDAASALAAQLDRHFKNKDLVWGVARHLEARAWIRPQASRPQRPFANRAGRPGGGEREVARRGEIERLVVGERSAEGWSLSW